MALNEFAQNCYYLSVPKNDVSTKLANAHRSCYKHRSDDRRTCRSRDMMTALNLDVGFVTLTDVKVDLWRDMPV